MTQNLTYGRGHREALDSPGSQKSDFVFIATPVSSLPDLHTDKEAPATLNYAVEVHYKEPVCAEPICEEPACGGPVCEELVYNETIYGANAVEEPQPVPDEEMGGFPL